MIDESRIHRDIEWLRQNMATWHIVKGEGFAAALGLHPKAFEYYDYVAGAAADCALADDWAIPDDLPLLSEVESLIRGYDSAREFYVDQLHKAILSVENQWNPTNIMYRTTDFRYRETQQIAGVDLFEWRPQNLDLTNRGLARALRPEYATLLSWEFEACALAAEQERVRVIPLFPFVQGERLLALVLDLLRNSPFNHPPAVGMMVEIPQNCIMISEYAKVLNAFKEKTAAEPFFVYGLNDLLMTIIGIPQDGSLTQEQSGIDGEVFPWAAFNFKEKPGFWDHVNRAITGALQAGIHNGVDINGLQEALIESEGDAQWIRQSIDFITEDYYLVDVPMEN